MPSDMALLHRDHDIGIESLVMDWTAMSLIRANLRWNHCHSAYGKPSSETTIEEQKNCVGARRNPPR